MQQVSEVEFWAAINKLDVHPQIIGSYPYTSLFKTRSGETKGIIENGTTGEPSKYLLPSEER